MTDAEKLRRLERALEYGGSTHSVTDLVNLVRDGKAQFWSKDDGSIVSEVLEFPQLKAINFWLLSGALKDVLALEDEVIDWALRQGCTRAVAMGRRGWGRVAAPTGWRLLGYSFTKELVP